LTLTATGESAYAARSPRLFFAYGTDDGDREVDGELGLALCRAVAARAAANEDRVLEALAAEAAAARETGEGGARVREVRVDRMLERAQTRGRAHYTLSPYVGCLIGCRFCYAQSRVADVRSDPYQAAEARYRLTRECLEAIGRAGRAWPPMILTRSTLVLRDVELLAGLPGAQVGFSVPTVDDRVRAHFEPRAAAVPERLAALGRLRQAGMRTFAVVQPLLPGPLARLADELAGVVDSAFVEVLSTVGGAGADFSGPWAFARERGWQEESARTLVSLLAARGVAVWPGELPADLGP
jgi:hypothetical protein